MLPIVVKGVGKEHPFLQSGPSELVISGKFVDMFYKSTLPFNNNLRHNASTF